MTACQTSCECGTWRPGPRANTYGEDFIFIAGHTGMLGSALVRRLALAGYTNVITQGRDELDLIDQFAVNSFFQRERIDVVLLAVARVGGIYANSIRPASFIYENLAVQTNVIHAAYSSCTKDLVYFGSSCIYPRARQQPIKGEHLLTGEFEKTNEAYAIAKVAGLKMCEAYNRQYGTRYVAPVPINLYGPNDNCDLEEGHVLAALVRKAHEAKMSHASSMVPWVTGEPRREFLHVDDLAEAVMALLESGASGGVYNVGVGRDISISEFAGLICDVVGYHGQIRFDKSKPDGTSRKLLDVSQLEQMGWSPSIELRPGLEATYRDVLRHRVDVMRSSPGRRWGDCANSSVTMESE